MKKLILVLILVMAVMLLAKNYSLEEVFSSDSSPKQVYDQVKGKVIGLLEYHPDRFREVMASYELELSQKEQRYISNISRTQADLLTFMNKYCDGKQSNLNLDAATVSTVCDIGERALAGDK